MFKEHLTPSLVLPCSSFGGTVQGEDSVSKEDQGGRRWEINCQKNQRPEQPLSIACSGVKSQSCSPYLTSWTGRKLTPQAETSPGHSEGPKKE